MFGGARRQTRHQPYPQLSRSTANPSASTAAAAAFMASGSQNPNPGLSSAAAAAALRARPHTPTNVSEVQTKRTMRRSPSVSSAGSSVSGTRRNAPTLERKGSSGSMTERTFRSPSPHGERRSISEQHPPVPAIPLSHKVSRTSTSPGVGMQNFKTASQKMESELPSWYTKPQGDTSNVRTSDGPMRKTRPESISSVSGRPDSQNSVNFSYPGRLRAQSPPTSPILDNNPSWSDSPKRATRKWSTASTRSNPGGKDEQALVYDPNSRRMVPQFRSDGADDLASTIAGKVPKRKKSQTAVSRSGSHLAKGTVARVKGSTVETAQQHEQQHDLTRREQPLVEKQHPSKQESPAANDTVTSTAVAASHSSIEAKDYAQQRRSPDLKISTSTAAAPLQENERIVSPRPGKPLARMPSIVREESEDEKPDDATTAPMVSSEVLNALDNVPTRQTVYDAPDDDSDFDQSAAQGKPRPLSNSAAWHQSPSHPKIAYQGIPERQIAAENKTIVGLSRDDSLPRRSLSQSPIRQARFAPSPAEGLVVRHTPLPRSASPIKSALKHASPSPRDRSPSDSNTAEALGSRSALAEQDGSLPRKKPVRVSFDDRSPIVVGESVSAVDSMDSPVLASPQQTRRPWYSNIGRNKKKDFTLEDDEVMKPRPALPSFGSVREKKHRDPEEQERPLIRPYEAANSPPTPASPVLPYSSGRHASPEPGQSSDLAIGVMLAQDQASRNEANISRFREPLPPVVTSVEGHGDLSDSMKSSEDEEGLFDTAADDSDLEAIPSTQTTALTMPDSQSQSLNGSTILKEKIPVEPEEEDVPAKLAVPQPHDELPAEQVPAIAITQPSPAAIDETEGSQRQFKKQYFDIPGMFPQDDSDENQQTQTATAAESVKEPEAAVIPFQAAALPQTTLATTPQLTMPEDKSDTDSNASIYSDAYEDLSDYEGDGFQSLDAVVESPPTKPSAASRDPDVTSLENFGPEEKQSSTQRPLITHESSENTQQGTNWESAKSFWKSLTAEKRRQLEQEAMDEAGIDADHEELRTPTRRLSNRTKKTAEQKQATSVAQAVKAQQAEAPATKSRQVQRTDPERTYMIKPGSRATHDPVSPTKSGGHMRTSMRGEQPAKGSTSTKAPPGPVHMRKSMRSSFSGDDSTSRRVVQPLKQNSAPIPSTTRSKTEGTVQGKESHHSAAAAAASRDVALSTPDAISNSSRPFPQRRGSDASDSSFKRNRAASATGFGFRRSMRSETVPAQPAPEAQRSSGRFSIRSLSPAGSPFRRASVAHTASPPVSMPMRRTLRAGSDSSRESKRSSMQFPSFGRSSGKAASSKSNATASRLGDSSDEEEPVRTFRSRFDNSSDEEDVRPNSSSKPLAKGTLRNSVTAPVGFKRSTTVMEEAEDSPDLPDSDDEDPSMQMPSPLRSPRDTAANFRPSIKQRTSSGIGTSTLQRSRSGRGNLVTSATAPAISIDRPTIPAERRSSFMSNILRRNKKADAAGKITRSELSDSAARRDTNLERSVAQLKDVRQPTSPKLQKRAPLSRGGSWPLPEEEDDGVARPNTSGGLVADGESISRPQFAGRRSTSLGLPGVEINGGIGDASVETTVSGPDGPYRKKKKFGALRRMFKLDD